MNRLTNKYEDGSGYEPIETHNVCNVNLYDFNYNDYECCVDKLGKLEDLEEQLGCPLEVIFKATENGIIDYEGEEHIVVYAEKYLFVVEDDKLKCAFHLKNYQKTWWLKGEKTNE